MAIIPKLRWGYVGLIVMIIAIAAISLVGLGRMERKSHLISDAELPVVFSLYAINQLTFEITEITHQMALISNPDALRNAFDALEEKEAQLASALNRFSQVADQQTFDELATHVREIQQASSAARRGAADINTLSSQIAADNDALATHAARLLADADGALFAAMRDASSFDAGDAEATVVNTTYKAHRLALLIDEATDLFIHSQGVTNLQRDTGRLRSYLSRVEAQLSTGDAFPARDALHATARALADGAADPQLLQTRLDLSDDRARQQSLLNALFAKVSALQAASGKLAEMRRQSVLSHTASLANIVHNTSIKLLAFLALSIGVTGYFAWTVLETQVARRLGRVTRNAREIENGNLTAQTAFKGSDEIALLGQSIDRLRALHVKRDRLESELNVAREEAETRATRRSEFLAMMSHEVRTPLNAITGMFELIARADIPDRQKTRATKGREAAEQLFALLSKVLDATRIEAGGIQVAEEPVRVSDLVEFVDERLQAAVARIGKDNLHTKVTAQNLDIAFETDPLLIRQILTNLIDNASRFTTTGAITIAFNDPGPDGMLAVDIIDTGTGIAEGDLDDIFEAFHQIRAGHTSHTGGSGLGLSISRNLAMLLGGSLTVKSVVGVGTTFTLSLPISDMIGTPYEYQNIAC